MNKNPSQKELVLFGVFLPVCAALLGFIVQSRMGSSLGAQIIWTVGGVLALFFWVLPSWRRKIFLGFGYLTYPLGWLMTKLLLLMVFLGVVTPTGILMRLFRKDLLGRRLEPERESYWMPRQGVPESDDYFRQS